MRITAEKLQVLFEVMQRAPASKAEQIVCQEVAVELIAQLAEQQQRQERRAAKAAKAGSSESLEPN